MPVEILPLAGLPNKRSASDNKDLRLINCFPERNSEEDVDIVKRAGLTETTDYLNAAEGRGITTFNGNLYVVIGNKVYKNTSTTAIATLTESTGRVHFDQTGGGSPTLLIKEATKLHTIDTSDTLTTISDADYPSTTVSGVLVLDTYGHVYDATGILYTSAAGNVTDWPAASFLTSEVINDTGTAITRLGNYVMTLNDKSVEYFYDAGNASGSPMSRLEGTISLIGNPAGNTVVNMGDEVMFVARGQGGSNYVARTEGLTPKPISTKAVDEALNGAGANITSAYAYPLSIMGHSFYVLTIPVAGVNQTWVFDDVDRSWSQWTSYDGTTESYFEYTDATFYNGNVVLLHEDNGKTYTMSASTYEDDGNIIKVYGATDPIDLKSRANHFMHRLTVRGDVIPSATLKVRWTNDDFNTFSSWRNVNLGNDNPFITRLGMFNNRSFEYRFENDAPMRLNAFELYIRQGHYSG